eukprot:4213019-Amphidinium_carterae.2
MLNRETQRECHQCFTPPRATQGVHDSEKKNKGLQSAHKSEDKSSLSTARLYTSGLKAPGYVQDVVFPPPIPTAIFFCSHCGAMQHSFKKEASGRVSSDPLSPIFD